MAELLSKAFKQTAVEFGLSDFQSGLLGGILLRNLQLLNDGNFDLIRRFPFPSEERLDGITQLNNQIKRFEIFDYEKIEIPYINTIIFYYISVAYLSKDTNS